MTQLHGHVAVVPGSCVKRDCVRIKNERLGLIQIDLALPENVLFRSLPSLVRSPHNAPLLWPLRLCSVEPVPLQLGHTVPRRSVMYLTSAKVRWILAFQWGSEGILDTQALWSHALGGGRGIGTLFTFW